MSVSLNELPSEIIDEISGNLSVPEFLELSTTSRVFYREIERFKDKEKLLDFALRFQNIEIVSRLYQKYNLPISEAVIKFAIISNSTELIRNLEMDSDQSYFALKTAACTESKTEIVKLLLNTYRYDTTELYNVLVPACYYKNNLKIVKMLARAGADITGDETLETACVGGQLDIVKFIIIDNRVPVNRGSALMCAADFNHYDTVKWLLENGADPNRNDCEAVYACIHEAHVDMFKLFIEYGVDPFHDDGGFIQRACYFVRLDIIKYLKSIDVQFPPEQSQFYFDEPCRRCDIEFVKYMVNEIGVRTPPILEACKYGCIEILKFLLQTFPNFKENLDIYYVRDCFITVKGNIEMMKLLGDYGMKPDEQVLNRACKYELEIVEYIVSLMDINIRLRISALKAACRYQNMDVIEYFLNKSLRTNLHEVFEYCIDKNVLRSLNKLLSFKPVTEASLNVLLVRACKHENLIIVDTLLMAGADVHQHYDMPLIIACQLNSKGLIELLLSYGADVHTQDDLPLIILCKTGNVETVSILVEHGANVLARDGKPLKIANEHIVPLLVAYGA
jgi:ankyrin repeat protein